MKNRLKAGSIPVIPDNEPSENKVNSSEKPKKQTFKKKETPLLILGALLFILILALFISLPMTEKGDVSSKNPEIIEDDIEKKFQNLEARMRDLSKIHERVRLLETQSKELDRLIIKFERLEASLSLKVNVLSKELKELQNSNKVSEKPKVFNNKPKKAVKVEKPPVVVRKKEPVKKPTPVKYHVIERGETFYSISRRYGLTLIELRDLNNLTEGATLYPGQKLRVSK